jgi:hypothetical protein
MVLSCEPAPGGLDGLRAGTGGYTKDLVGIAFWHVIECTDHRFRRSATIARRLPVPSRGTALSGAIT